MKRTTVVSTEAAASTGVSGTEHDERPERGSLKLFFSYAPFTGTTTALLDEVQGMVARGRDVFLEEMSVPATGKHVGQPFDVDAVLKRRPDLVALDDFAIANPPGSRNKYRYQDALELLHAGIDVYAVLRVSSLQGERDRITLITGREPRCSVPDHLFYNAQQVEFVDIDPEELAERSAIAARTSCRSCGSCAPSRWSASPSTLPRPLRRRRARRTCPRAPRPPATASSRCCPPAS